MVKLKWSQALHTIIVGTTAAVGAQVSHATPLVCILGGLSEFHRQLVTLLALLVSAPLALLPKTQQTSL